MAKNSKDKQGNKKRETSDTLHRIYDTISDYLQNGIKPSQISTVVEAALNCEPFPTAVVETASAEMNVSKQSGHAGGSVGPRSRDLLFRPSPTIATQIKTPAMLAKLGKKRKRANPCIDDSFIMSAQETVPEEGEVTTSKAASKYVEMYTSFFGSFLNDVPDALRPEVLQTIVQICKFYGYQPEEPEALKASNSSMPKISVTVDFDTAGCTRARLERIRRKAYRRLNGATVSVSIRQRTVNKTLTEAQAHRTVVVFFEEMLGSIMHRVQDIVEHANLYNAAHSARTIETGTPIALRRLYADISLLAEEDMPHTLHFLRRNVRLVNLRNNWLRVRNSLTNMDATGHKIVSFLNHPKRGVTYVSLAKKALCKKAGISPHKFSDYLRSAHIPAALVQHFGPGALLFCPNNTGGNRHRLAYPSAADKLFSIIASADRRNFIQQAAQALDQRIVRFVREGAPFPFKPADFVNVTPDTPLLSAMQMLEYEEDTEDGTDAEEVTDDTDTDMEE